MIKTEIIIIRTWANEPGHVRCEWWNSAASNSIPLKDEDYYFLWITWYIIGVRNSMEMMKPWHNTSAAGEKPHTIHARNTWTVILTTQYTNTIIAFRSYELVGGSCYKYPAIDHYAPVARPRTHIQHTERFLMLNCMTDDRTENTIDFLFSFHVNVKPIMKKTTKKKIMNSNNHFFFK